MQLVCHASFNNNVVYHHNSKNSINYQVKSYPYHVSGILAPHWIPSLWQGQNGLILAPAQKQINFIYLSFPWTIKCSVEVWPHTPCHCHGHNQPNILPIFKTIIHWHWCYHGMVAVVRNNYINICPSQEKCTDQQSHSNQLEGSKCFSEMLPSIYKGGRGVYGDWLCGSPERAPTLPMP